MGGKREIGGTVTAGGLLARQRLLVLLRSIPIGWATLLLIVFLLERPLLIGTAPLIGGMWIATARLGLDCAVLAATGWVVGRVSRPIPMPGVLAFAATLTLGDFSSTVGINIPWLLRLAIHTVSGESGYLDALVSTAMSQALLFGSLLAGGLLSRPSIKPVSIIADIQKLG
jgi:hypothetical protein